MQRQMMYCPSINEEKERSNLLQLVSRVGFGHWSCATENGIVINSLPFTLDTDNHELGMLKGHVARANPIWKTCSPEQDSVIIFDGGNAYISPNYYPSKKHNPMVVPTWNYMVVQIRGKARFIEDGDWLYRHLNELTGSNESTQASPWRVDDAPASFINKLIRAIVGVEIQISDISGKWKLGQNKSVEDQLGVAAALNQGASPLTHSLASAINERISVDKYDNGQERSESKD